MGRMVEVVSRARRVGCRLGGGLVSGIVWVGSLKLVPGLEEQVACKDVDEQVAWGWVGTLRLVPQLEEEIAVEEEDEISG
jgi:hypothetical protein